MFEPAKGGIGVIGCHGRLGRRIVAQARRRGIGVVYEKTRRGEVATGRPAVLIDASDAASLSDNVALAAQLDCALVVAVSNRSVEGNRTLEAAAAERGVLVADNLAFGHYLQRRVAGLIAGLIAAAPAEADVAAEVTVIDRHPVTKRDAPSGTAKELARLLTRPGFAPSVQCLRQGLPTSEHRIEVALANETLSVVHDVRSFDVAASGALLAAAWLSRRPGPGLWTMDDVYSDDAGAPLPAAVRGKEL